jgi:hypothetical protein
MRRLLDVFSLLAISLSGAAAIYTFDILALFASMLLLLVHPLRRCPSLYYLSFVFSLYYTIRYFSLQALGYDYMYDLPNQHAYLGFYFLIAAIFYALITLSVHYSSHMYGNISQSNSLNGYGVLGKFSIVLFAIASISGMYSIGREIENVAGRLIVRISLFFQYFQPYIFFSTNALFYLVLLSVALIFFGSKAFIFMLLLLYFYYTILADVKINFWVMAIFFVLIVISILMFDVMLAYRTSNTLDFSLVFGFDNKESLLDLLEMIGSKVGIRFAGLDTFVAYGQVESSFTPLDIVYELVTAINNFLFAIKIPLPDDFMPSEIRTAFIFRGYDFYDHLGGLRHTDSMFGLSRFISVDYGIGLLIFMGCLIVPFLTFRTAGYHLDTMLKMLFFNEVLIGGAYSTLFRLFIELSIIYLLLKLSFIRRMFKGKEENDAMSQALSRPATAL